jgi:hypothetical protein
MDLDESWECLSDVDQPHIVELELVASKGGKGKKEESVELSDESDTKSEECDTKSEECDESDESVSTEKSSLTNLADSSLTVDEPPRYPKEILTDSPVTPSNSPLPVTMTMSELDAPISTPGALSEDSGEYTNSCLCFPKTVKYSRNTVWNPDSHSFIQDITTIVRNKHLNCFVRLIKGSAMKSDHTKFRIKSKSVNPLINDFIEDCMDIVKKYGSSFDTVEKDWCKILFDEVRFNIPKWTILLSIHRKTEESVPNFSIEVMI